MVCLGKDYSHSSDANGNITDDGERIFYWDVEQRLFGILNKNTNRGTVFLYDGRGWRVREYDADLTSGALNLAQKADYAWCGSKVCQTRDTWGTSIEMPQGLIREGSPIAYYFHCDHLGSVVDVSQADGGHLARTMYSPYGQKKLLSSDAAYVEYAGMRFNEPSGLYLTYYRAYDPKLGRWLSRDPIGEAGGLNLYGYVGCRPLSYIDPWGLAIGDFPPPPPGYDPNTWEASQNSKGKWTLKSPNGDTYTCHNEDSGHWRHWDKNDGTRVPRDSAKTRPGQKNHHTVFKIQATPVARLQDGNHQQENLLFRHPHS